MYTFRKRMLHQESFEDNRVYVYIQQQREDIISRVWIQSPTVLHTFMPRAFIYPSFKSGRRGHSAGRIGFPAFRIFSSVSSSFLSLFLSLSPSLFCFFLFWNTVSKSQGAQSLLRSALPFSFQDLASELSFRLIEPRVNTLRAMIRSSIIFIYQTCRKRIIRCVGRKRRTERACVRLFVPLPCKDFWIFIYLVHTLRDRTNLPNFFLENLFRTNFLDPSNPRKLRIEISLIITKNIPYHFDMNW